MTTSDVRQYLLQLQNSIVDRMSAIDGGVFIRDEWQRPASSGGGGGISRILEGGEVFERAGILFSHVLGDKLPPTAAANRPEIAGRPWEAMGVSLVLHPRNPYAPTVHMNVRFFNAKATLANEEDAFWFGGGMDLTPYYGFENDAIHFHQTNKNALDKLDTTFYPRYKKWCDEYFWLKHRNEPRGIGGVFFDDFHDGGFAHAFSLQRAVGDAFNAAYAPIVERRKDMPYTESQREWQLHRRGRYVEFNLVWDRGTHFGLQSGGRTESILASMPPLATWRYNWTPELGTPEDDLLKKFVCGREWV